MIYLKLTWPEAGPRRTLEAATNKVPYASQSTCSPRNGLSFRPS
jgi:hypothetical protein